MDIFPILYLEAAHILHHQIGHMHGYFLQPDHMGQRLLVRPHQPLHPAFGGAILGAGLSIILKSGGCIDGSEIFANIILDKIYQKTGKEYSMSLILVLFNVCVYILVFIFIDQNAALMSLLVFIVATSVINHFTDHFEAVKQVTVITKDPEGIIRDIKEELNKTCTVIESTGAIAGENKTLICYVNYFELDKIKYIISAHEGSFSTVSTIDEIIS